MSRDDKRYDGWKSQLRTLRCCITMLSKSSIAAKQRQSSWDNFQCVNLRLLPVGGL